MANGVEADGAIINNCDINLVLRDTLPPRRRVWHARLAAGGFRLFLDRFAKLNRVARCVPGGVVRRRCPSEMGPYLILRRYAAFRTQFAARARGQPQHKQPIDSPRAPYRQLSHICHRLNPCPLPTCNRSRPAQTMIKLSAIIAG